MNKDHSRDRMKESRSKMRKDNGRALHYKASEKKRLLGKILARTECDDYNLLFGERWH